MPNLLSIERVVLFGIVFKGFSPDGMVPEHRVPRKRSGAESIHPANANEGNAQGRTEARAYLRCELRGRLLYTATPHGFSWCIAKAKKPEELVSGGPKFQLQDPSELVRQTTGLPSKIDVFSQDLRAWTYDRDDMTVRVEIATGAIWTNCCCSHSSARAARVAAHHAPI